MGDAKTADTYHYDLRTKVALLKKSNTELQAALEMSSSRIAELEADATTSSSRIAELEALKSVQAMPAGSVGSAHLQAGIASASPNYSVRRVAPMSPNGVGPALPAASPLWQAGISPMQSRVSPPATPSGLRVPGPVLGSRMSTGDPKTLVAPAEPQVIYTPPSLSSSAQAVVPTVPAGAVQDRRNGSIPQRRWASPHSYTNSQQPHPMLIRSTH